jgi:cytochrome c oxidase subunit 2
MGYVDTIPGATDAMVVAQGGLVPRGTRIDVFQQIYWVFVLLGTVVGAVVIGYMLYNAWKYRDDGSEDDLDRPRLGELPEGGGKGRKLFLSFTLSAVIVLSLIAWTYATLLFVESPGDTGIEASAASQGALAEPSVQPGEPLEVEVIGRQFQWVFVYPNGERTTNELRVPEGRRVELTVTSEDVFHNFGVPGLRAKTDAIPGQTTETWFVAPRTGEYTAHCYELCGVGHSDMKATVVVMEPEAFEEWYGGLGDE